MGRRKKAEQGNVDPKVQLVGEICSLASAASCAHRRGSAAFVDWYLVLGVDRGAGVDHVRRRYRHLALQLHPDKNKHPQAEVAFKLVSEAYACLSDEARRRAFDSVRRDVACQDCTEKLHRERDEKKEKDASLHVRVQRVLRAMGEEAKVIGTCLREVRRASRRETATPVFDPSDRLAYPDYPHRGGLHLPEEEVLYLRPGHASRHRSRRGRRCESPVYEVLPERASRYSRFGLS